MRNFVYPIAVAALASVALTAQPAIAGDGEGATTTQSEQSKKPKKITDRNHPDYRRCRSEPIIGSLARKRRVCMTNRKWAEMARQGNDTSRELVEDMRAGATNSN